MKNFDNKILLNSARNCLRYLVISYKIEEINIPYYICPVVWQTLRDEKVKIKFYHINQDFMPVKKLCYDEYILYPNYFGICGKQSRDMALMYPNLILDNAHAFFAEKTGLAAFYSPRKFLNVSDGGILDCNISLKEKFHRDKDRLSDIKDYNDFCKNEISIDNQPIKLMSQKTENFLKNVNFDIVKKEKRLFFDKIHKKLAGINNFIFNTDENDVPLVYPIKSEHTIDIAQKLIDADIYLLKYWTSLPNKFKESYFQNELLYIPITKKSLNIIEKYY